MRSLARQAYLSAGRPQQCAVCGYDRHFEVCHVRALKDFPATVAVSVVNQQDNLIALCPNHHWEFDNGLLDISSLGFPEFDHLQP
jgi:predicted restriction endonuclease